MKKKNTDNLQQEMMNAPDLNQFLSRNQESFVNASVSELLNQLFERKNISKAALAKQAGMSDLSASDFRRPPETFEEPPFMPVLRSRSQRGRNPGIVKALRHGPALSQTETRCDYLLRTAARAEAV